MTKIFRGLVLWLALVAGLGASVASANMIQASPAPGGGGGATSTWNPADKNADVTLTNADLTAASTNSGGGFANARSTSSYTTGQKYVKITINFADGGGSHIGVGLATGASPLNMYCGLDTTSACYYPEAGYWGYNNSFPADFPVAVTGDNFCVAFDITGYSGGSTTIKVSVNGAAYTSHSENIPNPSSPLFLFFSAENTTGTPPQVTVDYAGTGCVSPGGGYSPWN